MGGVDNPLPAKDASELPPVVEAEAIEEVSDPVPDVAVTVPAATVIEFVLMSTGPLALEASVVVVDAAAELVVILGALEAEDIIVCYCAVFA